MRRLTPVQWIALLSVLLIALNLRGPFTSLAPVLEQIMESLHLSASMAGIVTALPLAALAFFSPIAPKVALKIGLERALIFALMCIAVGVMVRSVGSVSPLLIGTVLLGAGIAFGNVLLPAVVKEEFPLQISVITSFYIFAMGIGSTLASSAMVPLSQLAPDQINGWQFALLFNLLFPVAALAFWLPKVFKNKTSASHTTAINTAPPEGMRSILRSPVAWQVTLALGINSFTFYSLAGWLPKILNDLGYSELEAGYTYGFLQFSTMVPGLLLMPILAKAKNHILLITICAGGVVVSLVGLIVAPQWAVFWVAMFGLTNCSTFIVAISFVGLRTKDSKQAALLSGMSQSLGYSLAATGPSLIGYLYTQTQGWTTPLLTIAGFGVVCTVFATLAARDKQV
jgi:CP family cyanate transporter-like MFS transporter